MVWPKISVSVSVPVSTSLSSSECFHRAVSQGGGGEGGGGGCDGCGGCGGEGGFRDWGGAGLSRDGFVGVEVENFGNVFGAAEEDLDVHVGVEHGLGDVDLWVSEDLVEILGQDDRCVLFRGC